MDTEKVISLLEKQYMNLSGLKDAALKKQTALISRNFEELQGSMQSEESYLMNITDIEKERVNLIAAVNKEFGFEETNIKLTDFVENLSGVLTAEQQESILDFERKIREKGEEIREVNQQNMYLINHAREFINDTINSLLADKKKSLLDRRV